MIRAAIKRIWLALSALVGLVAGTVGLTLLGSFPLYWGEIHWLKLTEYGFTSGQLFGNYRQLMAYLNFPWVQPLRMRDFPTSVAGAQHFGDVKQLFLLAWLLLLLSLPGLVVFFRSEQWRRQVESLYYPAWVVALLPVVVGGLAALDFDQFFVTFHHLFFNNNNWLFDPQTDPVIMVLPEAFFAHCFILAFVCFEAMLVVTIIRGYRARQRLSR